MSGDIRAAGNNPRINLGLSKIPRNTAKKLKLGECSKCSCSVASVNVNGLLNAIFFFFAFLFGRR